MTGMGEGGFPVWWLIGCMIVFIGGVYWIYRPSAKKRMDEAAKMPLKEDD